MNPLTQQFKKQMEGIDNSSAHWDLLKSHARKEALKSHITASHLQFVEAVEGWLKSIEQPLPKKPCRNAENHMFGSCFACERIKGGNHIIGELRLFLQEHKNEITNEI